ncbi:MAG: acyltransferase family protein [Candidatus Rokuibacteriota bacterium]
MTRLLSVDALRGLTVAAMVLVNNPGTWGAIYPPLRHAEWHGWTATDVIFPFFVFIVGVAIPLALGPRVARAGRRPAMLKILRRSIVIFALGIVLNGFPWFVWATLRIPGVLQRIAVCYLVAAVIYLLTSTRAQAIIASGLLLGYWLVMTVVPVSGYGAGDLSPEGNLAAYLDRALLGPHIWQFAKVYDPEGILSTVPAVATALLGVLTGTWLRSGRRSEVIAARLAVAGIVGIAVGELWGLSFPINKSLWTSSYVMLTSGLGLVALAACYWLVEVRARRRWAIPFAVLGVNALVLFFLSTLVARLLSIVKIGAEARSLQAVLFDCVFAPLASPVNASLAYAAAYVVAWWAIMWMLYRWNIRLRV